MKMSKLQLHKSSNIMLRKKKPNTRSHTEWFRKRPKLIYGVRYQDSSYLGQGTNSDQESPMGFWDSGSVLSSMLCIICVFFLYICYTSIKLYIKRGGSYKILTFLLLKQRYSNTSFLILYTNMLIYLQNHGTKWYNYRRWLGDHISQMRMRKLTSKVT